MHGNSSREFKLLYIPIYHTISVTLQCIHIMYINVMNVSENLATQIIMLKQRYSYNVMVDFRMVAFQDTYRSRAILHYS